jgi:hypothetical protein
VPAIVALPGRWGRGSYNVGKEFDDQGEFVVAKVRGVLTGYMAGFAGFAATRRPEA